MSESVNVKFLRGREAARAAFFSARTAERTVIKDFPLYLPGGEEAILVTLQSPNAAERGAIFKAAGIGKNSVKGKGESREVETATDLTTMQVEAIMACTYAHSAEDPGSPLVRFFTPEDRDGILARNIGGAYDELAEACLALVNVDEEAVRKNLKRTVSSSGDSNSPTSCTVPSPK